MPLGIPVVYDSISGNLVETKLALDLDDKGISHLRARTRQERRSGASRYHCGLCRDPLYVSNSGGIPHFAHYIESGRHCAWRAGSPRNLDEISASRFGGKPEGKLHAGLLRTLKVLCERSTGFSEVGTPNATFFGIEGTGHRYPDLQACFLEHRLAFEFQPSRTYLTTISDREIFYRQNRVFLIWLFHDFENWKGRQTERDIVALRSRHAFELDEQAIISTIESGSLTFKAHWQLPEYNGAQLSWHWESRLVRMEELHFDDFLVETLAAQPWLCEAELLNMTHAALIIKFEKYWAERLDWG
ncbi:hypothetical protein Rvan_1420 [Rhodomicrobium vannielii ATCC 17100]|uniref:DUF6035 domain-containing protein n=1 Tax=Rhodomicrobium vannielii (strain ATCC 17100 / DSM 162 / LMG 4299 / NCIMB 10020 / ATH 3.1.1) TaxID=648757 RepID=E3I6N0_RHOVT|nr:DUF6035 family protein [Rhodomicrobium vannielii]ADP70677.1 hypothetical protein Rvan_1420 [Rhodomicrobium vannielii ATCC 17100]